MDEVEHLLKVFISCDPLRKEELISQLMACDRSMLLKVLCLPDDAQERFRVYDLLVRLRPDGSDLLNRVLEECQDDSDPLSQLAAIEFVYENKMSDVANFVDLFNRNICNPFTIANISLTVSAMIVGGPEPEQYSSTVRQIIDMAADSNPDLLGSLPTLARNEKFARMMLESQVFQLWLLDYPYKPDLRTFNLYMKNLLAGYSERPRELMLSADNIMAAMSHPLSGLRCAAFEHLRVMAEWMRDEILAIPRLTERLFDASMDGNQDEFLARRKAVVALGLHQPSADGSGIVRRHEDDVGPDVMVI